MTSNPSPPAPLPEAERGEQGNPSPPAPLPEAERGEKGNPSPPAPLPEAERGEQVLEKGDLNGCLLPSSPSPLRGGGRGEGFFSSSPSPLRGGGRGEGFLQGRGGVREVLTRTQRMQPKARQEKLTVRDLPDETLVFDHARNKAHCLNRTVALVWRHCDGKTSVAELAWMLNAELGIPAEESVVGLALEQLGSRHLLEQPVEPLAGFARLSRRDVLKKLALAAVAMPLVMTITAPNARAAGLLSGIDCSRARDGSPCAVAGMIGICQAGKCMPSGAGANGVLVPPTPTPPAPVKCPAFQCHTLRDCPPTRNGLKLFACRGGTATVCGDCIYGG